MLNLLILLCGFAGAQPATGDLTPGDFRVLVRRANPAQARRILTARIQKAVASSDKTAELGNRYVLGGLLKRWHHLIEAQTEFERALQIAGALKQKWMANRIRSSLAEIAETQGMPAQARQYLAARTAGAPTLDDAAAMVVVSRVEVDPSQRIALLKEALQVVQSAPAANKFREGALLQMIANTCMTAADYQCALRYSREAGDLFDRLGARRRFLDVLRLQGTLHLEHGKFQEAEVVYRRVWQTELLLNDRPGDLRTPAMLAVALAKQGQRSEALEILRKSEEALQKAKNSPAARFSASVTAIGYSEIGEHQKAVALFEQLLQTGPIQPLSVGYLAQSYYQLGRYRDCIEATTRALSERSPESEEGSIRDGAPLWWRAQAREKLGETENALKDAITALDTVEQARQHLVQSDSMKRGFANRGKEIVDFVIELAFRQKRYAEAFTIAEQARARAFLDLLASRDGRPEEHAATMEDSNRLQRFFSRLGDPMVVSDSYSEPASLEQMQQSARRLNSTLIAYWVTPTVVYVWMLEPGGEVRAAHHRIRESDLKALVERVRKRSDNVDRGAWRSLHAALIEPVRAWLPKSNTLITVIPHGPLFDVPFAALAGSSGRYMVEDYRFHYVPSASVLQFTRSDETRERYLVIADPAKLPALPSGRPLPALPASRKEARAIAATVPAASITVLQGAQALLEPVRASASSASVIHFATHAVIQPDKPLESFLALASGQRLTASDVYEMTLPSSLVVMSACRSASGPISSDGVNGLSRAFFAAGASSVVASVWDVADEPASQLMTEFYARLRKTNASEALRSAQLAIIQRLRDGKLTISTKAGPAVLPEHPMLWAGFQLSGEP